MNTPNPLMPQGSLPQCQSSGKSTVRIAVFTIVAIHAVFFSGLLMQGCNKRDATTAANRPGESTNVANELPKMSNDLFYANVHELPSVPGTAAPTISEVTSHPAIQPSVATQPQATLPAINPPQLQSTTPQVSANTKPAVEGTAPETKEYTIVRGDNFSKIAKANRVTVTALRKANPNVHPEKIQPGHRLQIPAPAPAPANVASAKVADARPASGASDSNGSSHVVKPGENLTKIAKQHGTTISAIKAANPKLKTNRLLVGEKLKMPATASVPSPLTSTNPDRGTALR